MNDSLVSAPAHKTIDVLALNYSKKRERVTEIANTIEDKIRAIYRTHRRELNEALATAEGAQSALRAEVQAHPELFEKPRTWALHGIKLGYRKGSGKLEWDDDADVIARIRKQFSTEEAALLIKVTEKPIVEALKDLDVKSLTKLGITAEDTGDVVTVSIVDTATNKLVKRLLKEGARGEETEA